MDDRLDRVPRRLSIAAISVACVFGFASRVGAQSADAESLFNDGDSLMKQGKLPEACDAFDASNRIEPRAGTLIRLGECREANHQLASAWSAYKDALTRVKDAKKKAIATAKVAELEPKLSYLTVSVPDESRVDGLTLTRNGQPLDPVLWNRAVPVNGGDYIIGGRAPGHEEWKTTVTVPNESGKVSLDVPKFKEIGKLVMPVAPLKPTPVVKPVEDDEPQPAATATWTPKRKIAIGLAAGATVALVGGIVLGSAAKSKQSDARSLCPDPATPCADAAQANALISTGQSRALDANILFAIAGVAAIGGGVLWFTGGPEQPSRHVAIAPSITPGTTTLVVSGRF